MPYKIIDCVGQHLFTLRAILAFSIVFLGMIVCDAGLLINSTSQLGLYQSVGVKGIVVFFVMAVLAPIICWYLGFTYYVCEDALVRSPLFGLLQKEIFNWRDLEKVRVKPSQDNPRYVTMYFRNHRTLEISSFYFGFDRLLVFLVTRYPQLFG